MSSSVQNVRMERLRVGSAAVLNSHNFHKNPMPEPNDEKELIRRHPKMFRNRPFSFTLSLALVPVVIGAVILLVWWIKTHSRCLIVTDEKTRLRKGLLSKETNDVMHSSVRNIQVEQGAFQRLLGTGDIRISSSGQSGIEVNLTGVQNPGEIRDLINRYR